MKNNLIPINIAIISSAASQSKEILASREN